MGMAGTDTERRRERGARGARGRGVGDKLQYDEEGQEGGLGRPNAPRGFDPRSERRTYDDTNDMNVAFPLFLM